MAKIAAMASKTGLVAIGVFLVVTMLVVLTGLRHQKMMVTGVLADGSLELKDGRVISLAEVRVRSRGEEGAEAGLFLLSEMTSNKEVWVEKSSGEGYWVWIGCTKNLLGIVNCVKGIKVNSALLQAGVVTKI